MLEQRFSDNDVSRRTIPSFIEPRPPLIQNPFMRPRPQKGTNLLELFEEDSEIEEPEWLQVYLRMKPCKVPNTLYEVRSERCLVTSLDTATAGHGRRTQHNVSKMYTFSKIFGAECKQNEIFEAVVKDNLKKLPEGQNFTLLTYGASGSGKTYTLMGTVGAPGLVPRSLEYVFRLVDAAQQPAFRPAENGAEKLSCAEQDYELQWVKRLRHVSAPLRDKYRRMSTQLHSDLTVSSIDLSNRIRHYVWVSFVEIYNEAVYDLLAPPEKRTKLRIREDSSGNVYVKGATQAFVRTGEEAYDVMVAGKHNLVVAATGVHAHSSRSHCIFTITMLTETGEGSVRTSYVRLCDLAGCERARATRNTGARMQESRAINSSLHVLERCLHMLRRKQRARHDAMVPYRESKLTRLLGTGLSGLRGEAVSMVVTLNPSPEYAHETKHVLSLAAVAQDIQINNTMLASTLESSTQETTINSSYEVMKLRSDNERLHFELVQAQARNKELLASMEERQQETANTMRELVEEAKDLTKQYYEAQLEALRCEMEDMVEEYEARLAEAAVPPPPPTNNSGTPSRFLQAKVAQLMTEIAVLEEKLTAERLARARAEKEVEHLRTCIEERDEKAFKDTTPPRDVMSLSDSEQESEEESDPLNESLEPVFKKELDKSLSIVLQKEKRDTASIHTIDNIDEECDIDLDKSHETLKNGNVSNTSTYATGEDEDSDLSKKVDVLIDEADNTDSRIDDSVKTDKNILYDDEIIIKNNDRINNDVNTTYNNETTYDNYCNNSLKNYTKDADDDNNTDIQFQNECRTSSKHELRGTYFISDSKVSEADDSIVNTKEQKMNSFRGTYFVKDPVTNVSKSENDQQEDGTDVFKIPLIREKSNMDTKNPDKVLDNIKSNTIPEKSYTDFKKVDNVNPMSNKSVSEFNVEKAPEKLSENLTFKTVRAKSNIDMKVSKTISETLVSKIMRSFKSNQGSDVSLRQFEQLEKASKECNDDVQDSKSVFGDIKILKEKRTYFDDVPAKENEAKSICGEVPVIKEQRTYFDNIYENTAVSNKKLNEIMKVDDDRSPSIVKDVVSDTFEPSTIKMLLGDNITKPDILSSVHKPRLTKKHISVDIFDGFDSPIASKPKEPVDNVEIARQSIENMVLEQQLAAKKDDKEVKLSIREIIEQDDTQIRTKEEIKLDPVSSEESESIRIIEESNECKVEIKLEPAPSLDEPNQTMNVQGIDNTIEEFENIYKNITAPRATEFELLVSQEEKQDKEDTKYNLRKKSNKADNIRTDKSKNEKVLAESQTKSECQGRKRNLRLRRKKNEEADEKLKDIVNLQSEFSDVTLDVPAPHKVVKDIPSPEKDGAEEENLPPLMGIQSCPSKSVTRSRRKLFTPRAEPLEESLSQTGDSNERIYVPRPSYHRPRARRKL